MVSRRDVVKALAQAPATTQRLKRQDFDLTNGTANARTKIASYQAESPIAFREEAVRLMFVQVEQFQTPGDGSTTTYNLDHDILPTSNTTDFVLYDSGGRVQADQVDYAGNSFDYTNPDAAAEYLHAYYVPRDPVKVEVVKSAPKSQGKVSEVIYDDTTSILHERNQHKEPPEMDFSGRSALAPVVPRKWTVDVYADGPVGFDWNDDDTANSQGTTAVNAVVSLPVNRAQQDVSNLAQAVKQDIIW
jgi:hypothetical protein